MNTRWIGASVWIMLFLLGLARCQASKPASEKNDPPATATLRSRADSLHFDIPAISVPEMAIGIPATSFDAQTHYDASRRTLDIDENAWRYRLRGPTASLPQDWHVRLTFTPERALRHEQTQPDHTYFAVFRVTVKVEVLTPQATAPLVLYQASQTNSVTLEERLALNDDFAGHEPSYYNYSISGVELNAYFLNNNEVLVDEIQGAP